MDPQLKQRLVGAAVLVALAVILIPTFLEQDVRVFPPVVKRDMAPLPAGEFPEVPATVDGATTQAVIQGLEASNEQLAGKLASVTAAPDAPPPLHTVPERSSPVLRAVPEQRPRTAVPERPRNPPPPAAHAPIVAKIPPPTGHWIIQLGSFTNQENAESLQARLQKSGLAASISPLVAQGLETYRVLVGVPTTHEAADRLNARVLRELGISGRVIRTD